MKKKEVVNVRESDLSLISNMIMDFESQFKLSHPFREVMAEARSKIERAIVINRSDKMKPQSSWVYVVESDQAL